MIGEEEEMDCRRRTRASRSAAEAMIAMRYAQLGSNESYVVTLFSKFFNVQGRVLFRRKSAGDERFE